MVERRPVLTFFSHVVLIVGLIVIAFPVYVTFVASTMTPQEVLAAPMSLVPGSHLIENYMKVITSGAGLSSAPVGRKMIVQKRRPGPAPSMVAASISECGIDCSPARKNRKL